MSRHRTDGPAPMSRRRLRVIAIGALVIGVAWAAEAFAAGANAIYNGAFGTGLHGWRVVVVAPGTLPGYPHISVVRTPREPILKCEREQRNHPFLQMNVADGANGYVEQDIILPAEPGQLRFRAWGELEPVKVAVSLIEGPIIHRLLTFTAPALLASPTSCSGRSPLAESLNVARYAGEALGLRIRATGQGAEGAVADVDDFVLGER